MSCEHGKYKITWPSWVRKKLDKKWREAILVLIEFSMNITWRKLLQVKCEWQILFWAISDIIRNCCSVAKINPSRCVYQTCTGEWKSAGRTARNYVCQRRRKVRDGERSTGLIVLWFCKKFIKCLRYTLPWNGKVAVNAKFRIIWTKAVVVYFNLIF